MPEPVQRSAIGNLFFRGLDRIIPGQNYQDGRWNASGRQYALAAVPFVAGFLGGPLASQASRFAINKYEQGRTPQQAFNPQVTRMPMSIPNGFNLGIGRPQFQPTQPMPQPVQ